MKLNSKSGATLAAAAATLFLAGAVVSTVSTPANAAGKCMAGNACKGQSACKGSANSCKGQNGCKGQGFLGGFRKAVRRFGRQVRQGLIHQIDKEGSALPGPRCFDPWQK